MKKPRVFVDASVLIAAVLGKTGASQVLFKLAKNHFLEIILTDEIIREGMQSLARKYGQEKALVLHQMLNDHKQVILATPSKIDLDKFDSLITDHCDRHVLAGAQKYKAEYLVTLDRKHFFTEKMLNTRLDFRIMLPGDFLKEFRQNISKWFFANKGREEYRRRGSVPRNDKQIPNQVRDDNKNVPIGTL